MQHIPPEIFCLGILPAVSAQCCCAAAIAQTLAAAFRNPIGKPVNCQGF
jgi:hypothetical protein